MITGRGYTLLPLQGEVFPVVLGYPGCRFACPGLSARWAFSPLHLMAPLHLMDPLYLILHIKLDTLIKNTKRGCEHSAWQTLALLGLPSGTFAPYMPCHPLKKFFQTQRQLLQEPQIIRNFASANRKSESAPSQTPLPPTTS